MSVNNKPNNNKKSSLFLLNNYSPNSIIIGNHRLMDSVRVREYQSAKKWANAGYLDTLTGVYEDPNYKLDLKPEEIRDGQPLHYVSEFGVMIVSVPATLAILLGVSFLTFYTLFDSQPTFLRGNPNPFMLIRDGRDAQQTRNPIMSWTYPYGPHATNLKLAFYYEIKDALNRKEKVSTLKNRA